MRTKNVFDLNPMCATFRQKTKPTHKRLIYCHRIGETEKAWVCSIKVLAPGHNYIRHMAEIMEKALWEHMGHKYVKIKPKKEKPFVPDAAEFKLASESEETQPIVQAKRKPGRPRKEEPAPAPPPTPPPAPEPVPEPVPAPVEEPVEVPEPVLAAVKMAKTANINEEFAGEYNPRAHPKEAAGKEEDLIVFDDLVNSNFIAQQRKNKLMQLRAKRQNAPTPAQPVVVDWT